MNKLDKLPYSLNFVKSKSIKMEQCLFVRKFEIQAQQQVTRMVWACYPRGLGMDGVQSQNGEHKTVPTKT